MYLWAIFLRENLMLFPPYVSSCTAELCGFDYLKAFCRLWSASCCWLGRHSTAMRRLVKKKYHIVRFITYYSIEINFLGGEHKVITLKQQFLGIILCFFMYLKKAVAIVFLCINQESVPAWISSIWFRYKM